MLQYEKATGLPFIGEEKNATFNAPLMFDPGDRWEYSVAVDVQGRLLEVLNGGKPLHEVLAERIFKPLGMTDSSFQVGADKINRVAQPAPATGAALDGRPGSP